MFLTFGKDKKGNWVGIGEVSSGKTELTCPYCNTSLIAKKGNVKQHHFAHDGETCQVSKEAVAATQIPMWDSFELLDKSELKYIERRGKYAHADMYSYSGMDEAVERLEVMSILDVKKRIDPRLTTTMKNLKRLKPHYVTTDNKPTEELKALFSALMPLGDIGSSWRNSIIIEKTSIDRAYHTNKLDKQKTVKALEKAQRYWFDAYVKRQAIFAPEFMDLFKLKFDSINKQHLYVMRFEGDFTDGVPSTFIKIGFTSRSAEERLKEVKTMLAPFGAVNKAEVLCEVQHLGRLERLLHRFFSNANVSIGSHREFFNCSIENDLIKQLKNLDVKPYVISSVKTEKATPKKAGRKKQTDLEIIAAYPDVIESLSFHKNAIRPTARETKRSVNTVQKVLKALENLGRL